ncbi:MAG: insulinase family protein [Blastocatellia bacterium]|nr:insulinase family protein [Blastocatellia bacterium]
MTEFSKSIVPEPLEEVPFEIANALRATLPNGLRVVMLADDRVPLVSYRLVFMAGDANDPADHLGVTSAMTALITEGTEKYSSRELSEKIERLGASLSASSSDDFTFVAASALSMYNDDMMQLLEEVVFKPTFPENELDLYRRNTIEHLKYQRSQPNFLVSEQMNRVLYGEHPYSVSAPTPDDIRKLTRDQLEAIRIKIFLPNNAILFVVGDVRNDEMMLQIEERFGDWEAGERHVLGYPEPPERSERTLTIVDRPGSAQANIALGDVLVKRNHPDYFPLLVMNQVLGAGASSRIFMNLREEKGYTYGAYSRLDMKREAGSLEATAEVRTAVTGESLKELFYELERIRSEEILEGEMDDAKNFLTGVFPIRAETQEGLAGLIVSREIYDLPHDYLETYREKISNVTAADVRRVAEKYVRPEKMAMVMVGDASDIVKQAEAFTTNIEVYDKSGKPKDEGGKAMNGETANVSGAWTLNLDFQGQNMAVEMTLEQEGEKITGELKTMLGIGKIDDGRIDGNAVTAVARTEIQGETAEFQIDAEVDGDSISGTVNVPMLGAALDFVGKRKAAGAEAA